MRAKVKWVDGQQFIGINERNQTVVMDSLPEAGGEGIGMKPTELFLIALAGCTAIDIVSIMKKKRQAVTDFSVEVEGIQREEHPKAFEDIKLIYKVKGENVDEVALQRAIQLSEEKYCSVRATLLGMPIVPNITHSYEIET
ncbi:MAG: OsmC family protein [Actinobacteria bacterium]|nr:OsmC family protein [Actinomycetota bacterium]